MVWEYQGPEQLIGILKNIDFNVIAELCNV